MAASSWLGEYLGITAPEARHALGHITQSGDAYMRSLLVLGARAVLNTARTK